MLKCSHCGDEAKEISIRNDERRKIATEVQQLLNDLMGKLSICGPNSPQRPMHQGGVVALTQVLAKLGVKYA